MVPTWHTLQVVEEEPMRKKKLRFLKKMEGGVNSDAGAESPVLWEGEGGQGHPIA